MLTTVLKGSQIECLQKWAQSQSKKSKLPIMFIALIVFGTIISVERAKPAKASEDDYMFCEAGDDQNKVWYFSTIFLGDYTYE